METTQKRVRFDFEIEFTNGGGIQGQDFRLDIAGDDISDEELAERRKAWAPRPNSATSGYLWKYAQGVGPAVTGAVTHPGGAKETQTYADV